MNSSFGCHLPRRRPLWDGDRNGENAYGGKSSSSRAEQVGWPAVPGGTYPASPSAVSTADRGIGDGVGAVDGPVDPVRRDDRFDPGLDRSNWAKLSLIDSKPSRERAC